MATANTLTREAERELARIVAAHVPADKQEIEAERYRTVVGFLLSDPERFSSRLKEKPEVGSIRFVTQTAARFFAERASRTEPSLPQTVPDPVVAIVLSAHFGVAADRLHELERDHQAAMAAENVVGKLLERYLARHLEPHGWVWCAGDFVRAIDFIIRDRASGWRALQVKNRDNSENSSSSAIRRGTAIKKWFRTFARTGETNWPAFPETATKFGVSEDGFREFVLRYFEPRVGR